MSKAKGIGHSILRGARQARKFAQGRAAKGFVVHVPVRGLEREPTGAARAARSHADGLRRLNMTTLCVPIPEELALRINALVDGIEVNPDEPIEGDVELWRAMWRSWNGERDISDEMAILLAHAFGTTHQFWMNLQARYHTDIVHAAKPRRTR